MNETTQPAANRILVVDDNETIHADFKKILAPAAASDTQLRDAESLLFGSDAPAVPDLTPAYELVSAFQGQEGLQRVEEAASEGRPFALAFVDVRMPPGWDGIETIERIWRKYPDLPVVICTAYSDYSWPQMMSRLGRSDNLVVLRKPFDAVEVLQLAHSLTHKWRLARQVRAHIEELDGLVQARTRSLQEANEALRQSEEHFAKAFRNNPAPLLLWNVAAWQPMDVNESFLQLTGFPREDVVGPAPAAFKLFTRPEVEQEIRNAVGAGRQVRGRQAELRARDQRTLTVLVSAEPLELQNQPHALMSLQDITDRINMENQLRQAQKMEAVGQIAAGVAHDFNNIMAVIQGHAELQLSVGSTDEALLKSLQEISQASGRAVTLTRQLLAFSRKQMLRPRPLNLPELLVNLGQTLQRTVGEQVSLQVQCAENLPPVLADQVNLEQIILNLAVNARDAMPRGGPLTITAELATVDARHREQQSDALAGTFIKLSVTDKGIGMDQAVRRKLFEPFFTTKTVGKGRGLGLATVYGIVKQHQGWIEVASQPGVGSTFTVYLPLAQGGLKNPFESATDFIQAINVKAPASSTV